MEKLYKQLEKKKVRETVKELYEKTIEDAQAALKMVGTKAEKKNVPAAVKNELVNKRLASKGYLNLIQKVIKINTTLDTSRQEVASLEFEEDRLSKETFNLISAEKGKNVEKYKITANYAGGKKTAGIWLFGDKVFVIEEHKQNHVLQ